MMDQVALLVLPGRTAVCEGLCDPLPSIQPPKKSENRRESCKASFRNLCPSEVYPIQPAKLQSARNYSRAHAREEPLPGSGCSQGVESLRRAFPAVDASANAQ